MRSNCERASQWRLTQSTAHQGAQLTAYQKLKKSRTSFSLVCELMPFTWTVFDMVAYDFLSIFNFQEVLAGEEEWVQEEAL